MTKIRDSFIENPFSLQHLATQEMAVLDLCGHEEQITRRIEEIKEVTHKLDFDRNNAQHTIIFGEWGHGKTHLLHKMKRNLSDSEMQQKCWVLQIRPLGIGRNAIRSAICEAIELEERATEDEIIDKFIKVAEKRHILLLIDEAQMLSSEVIGENETKGYFQFLQNLLDRSRDQAANVHFIHCFSCTAAEQVRAISHLPLIKELARNRIFLHSLDKDEQKKMLIQRMKQRITNEEIKVEFFIPDGVNAMINELTGGNPRHVLDIISTVFEKAVELEQPCLTSKCSFEALKVFPRHDCPSLTYIQEALFMQILKKIRNFGTIREKSIAEFLESFRMELLGSSTPVDQTELRRFNLNAGKAASELPVLKYKALEQDDDGALKLSHQLRREIGLMTQLSIQNKDEKSLQWDLILRPEDLLPRIRAGLERILKAENKKIINNLRKREDGVDALLLDWQVESSGRVKLLIAIYKGDEIPKELLTSISEKIFDNIADLAIIIAETEKPVDSSIGSFSSFISTRNAQEKRELHMRLLFRNGSQSSGTRFSEQFFIILYRIGILSNPGEIHNYRDEYLPIYNEMDIDGLVNGVINESFYLPTKEERVVLEFFYNNKDRAFTLGKLREEVTRDNIGRELLDRLTNSNYLIQNGKLWKAPGSIEGIKIFNKVIAELRKSPKTYQSIANEIRKSFIVRHSEEEEENVWRWILNRLIQFGCAKQNDEERYIYVDIEKECRDARKQFDKEYKVFRDTIGKLKEVAANESDYSYWETKVEDNKKLINQESTDKSYVIDIVDEIKRFTEQAQLYEQQRKNELINRADAVLNDFNEMSNYLEWPYNNLDNPFRNLLNNLENASNDVILFCKEHPDARKADEVVGHFRRQLNIARSIYKKPEKGELITSSKYDAEQLFKKLLMACASKAILTGKVIFRKSGI